MGPSPRGGAYTYDWIENLLGLDMHSADRVLPEYQHPQVGDTTRLRQRTACALERVEPERVLATRSEDGNWVWTFVLDEQDGTTRLISRNRFRLPTLAARIGMLPMEPASLVMERKMLHGHQAARGTPRDTRKGEVPCLKMTSHYGRLCRHEDRRVVAQPRRDRRGIAVVPVCASLSALAPPLGSDRR